MDKTTQHKHSLRAEGGSRMPQMRQLLLIAAVLMTPFTSLAVTCTTQAAMQTADRDFLVAAAGPLADAVAKQNFEFLQSSLLPSVTGEWESIRNVALGAKSLLQGGTLQWRNSYLLDATDLKAPSDTQFFCTNTDSSLTVTVNLRSLPAGRYALVLADFPGAPLAGQLALMEVPHGI